MVRKKILIITYYWPPAGGPGVQRWLKFTKYLPEFGWKPTVFIPENPSYPLLDESLSKDLSPDLETIKTKIWEPYQLYFYQRQFFHSRCPTFLGKTFRRIFEKVFKGKSF